MALMTFCRTFLTLIAFMVDNQLPQDTLIETTSLKMDDKPHNSYILGLGTSHESDWAIADFEVNLSYPKTLIGLVAEAGWGISCDNEKTIKINSCFLMSNDTTESYYGNTKIKVKPAEIHLRLSGSIKLNILDLIVPKLPISLIVGGDSWPMENWGVIGLSPQGDFAAYYRSIYRAPFQILMQFKSSTFDQDQKHVQFKLNSVLNPIFKNEDIIAQNSLEASEKFWSLQGGLKMISDLWNIKSGKICLTSLTEDVLIVPDAKERCDAIKKMVCNIYAGEPCVKQVADFSKAPILEIEFAGKSAKISPEMYLYFQDNNLECRFEEFRQVKQNECDPESSFGVGKFFLQYFILILEYGKDGNNQAILINHFERDTDEPKWWALIFLFSIFAVAIIVFYFLVIFEEIKSRREEEDLSQILIA